MPKIIKRSHLVMSSPKIVKSFGEPDNEVAQVPNAEFSLEIESQYEPSGPSNDLVQEQRRELESIREESEQILKETEELVKDIMARARDEARVINNQAQEEAELIIHQARQEAEKIQREAREQAYREGLRQANEAIEADRQMAMEQSRQMVEDAQRNKMAIISSTETDMVRLILAISKKVIAHEIQTRPELIVEIVQQAVSYLDNPDQLRIYVNPQELQLLVDTLAREKLAVEGNRDVPVAVKPDNGISPGGCVVESGGASVDSTLETRISKVEEALLDIPGSER